jgi:hypothetical protein
MINKEKIMSDSNKIKRIKAFKSASKNNMGYENISFNDDMPPVKRKKKKYRRKNSLIPAFVMIALIFILATGYFIALALHPAGVFEYISSTYACVGEGAGYPVKISGGKVSYNLSLENKFFLITDNMVSCYSDKGKIIAERPHNFSSPVVKAADTRYIVYGQGEKELSVNTYGKELFLTNFSSGIIDANICDAGRFVVASKSDGYDSSVAIFDKNNNKIFEWFSADETVNSVALSPSGKAVAVSTVKVENGKFISSFYVLKYNSADPVMKKIYTDQVIYRVYSISESNFGVVFANNVEFLNYKKNTVVSHQSDYSISMVKKFEDKLIVLRTVAANQDESIVELYKKNGTLISSFKINNQVKDISYKSGKVFTLELSGISKYDKKGKMLSSADASFDSLYIETFSDNGVAVIRNSVIEQKTLTKMGD